MAGSTFGTLFRITTWGESHGPALGVVVDGCPAGIPLTTDYIQAFLDRRKPGQSKFTTARRESDTVEILSGVFEGYTTGTPLSLVVRNNDQRSAIVRGMPIIHLIKNTDYVTIAAADVLPEEKLLDALPAELSLPAFLNVLE